MRRAKRIVSRPNSWIRALRTPPGTAANLEGETRWIMTASEREAILLRLSASRREDYAAGRPARSEDE